MFQVEIALTSFFDADINEIREDMYDYGRDFGYLFDLETYLPTKDKSLTNEPQKLLPFAYTLRHLLDTKLIPGIHIK